MATEIVQTTFGYEALDEAKRVRIQVKAESIRARMKRTADDIIAIGLDLIDVKEDLGHGQFEHWISAEFDMNLRSAQRFMQAAERFDSQSKSDKLSSLPVSVLYLLASPSIPDEVVEGVLSGEIPAESKAIKEAREAREALLRKEEEAEQIAREKDIIQRQFFEAQQEIETLKESLAEPQVIEVIPPQMVEELEQEKRRAEEADHKARASAESRRRTEDKNNRLTYDLQRTTEEKEKLKDALSVQVSFTDQQLRKRDRRRDWRQFIRGLQQGCSQSFHEVPSSEMAAEFFEDEDWDLIEAASRPMRALLTKFDQLGKSRAPDSEASIIVDANASTEDREETPIPLGV